MADYAFSISRFFEKREITDDVRLLIRNLATEGIKIMKRVFLSLANKPAIDTYKTTTTLHEKFRKEYKQVVSKLVLLIKDQTPEEVAKMFHGGIIVLKHIERLIDHLSNISENFVFIKQFDFFTNKRTGNEENK
jgi:phosphate uptake regulator